MERTSTIRADAGILVALFIIGLSTTLPVGVLYWLMRPTLLPNPGISAYQTPRPDPAFPRVPRGVEDSHALSIAAAKRANELLNAHAGSGFVAGQHAKATAEAVAPATGEQKRQRSARIQRRQSPPVPANEPAMPVRSWAFHDHAFGNWYR